MLRFVEHGTPHVCIKVLFNGLNKAAGIFANSWHIMPDADERCFSRSGKPLSWTRKGASLGQESGFRGAGKVLSSTC